MQKDELLKCVSVAASLEDTFIIDFDAAHGEQFFDDAQLSIGAKEKVKKLFLILRDDSVRHRDTFLDLEKNILTSQKNDF